MATDRLKQLLLVALLVVVGVLAYRWWAETSAAPAAASNPQGAQSASATSGRRSGQAASGAPEVHLDALDDDRPKPSGAERNLFRFKPKAPPPPPPPPPVVVAPPPQVPTGPPPVPPPPPITLKFIGMVKQKEGLPKIAILTDGVGPPLYAAEGQTVAGRYRILRIGEESIEMAYLDGRGRQTIRLSGS
jgi:hypothetical protein